VVVVGAGRWAAGSPRRVPCPSTGSATSARSEPTSAPVGAPGTQPPRLLSQPLRWQATLAPAMAPHGRPRDHRCRTAPADRAGLSRREGKLLHP
jgi:hypothetical protein